MCQKIIFFRDGIKRSWFVFVSSVWVWVRVCDGERHNLKCEKMKKILILFLFYLKRQVGGGVETNITAK